MAGILGGADLTAKGQGKGANTQRAGVGSCRLARKIGRHLPRYPFCCARSAGSVGPRPRPIAGGCWQLGFKPCCTGACRVTDPKTVKGDGRATHLPEILFFKDRSPPRTKRDEIRPFLGGLLPSGFSGRPIQHCYRSSRGHGRRTSSFGIHRAFSASLRWITSPASPAFCSADSVPESEIS
jgi:hypothetical protein